VSSPTVLTAFLASRTRENRDRLVATYWYLCERGAKKFYRAGVDRADLVQVAAIGLIKSVEHYDPALRTPFEAYAWLLVVGELMHYVRDHERIVRTPRWLRALEKPFAQVNESLGSRLGRAPTALELARELGVSIAVVDELRLLRRGGTVVSLEAVTGSPTGELPAPISALDFEDRLSMSIALEELAERERTVVLGSFAVGLSQAELGRKLGLSQSQVSKLIKKALLKIHPKVA